MAKRRSEGKNEINLFTPIERIARLREEPETKLDLCNEYLKLLSVLKPEQAQNFAANSIYPIENTNPKQVIEFWKSLRRSLEASSSS